MDHRAKEETAFINGLSHPVLDYVGAKVQRYKWISFPYAKKGLVSLDKVSLD